MQPIPPEGVEALRADFLARGDVRSATLVCVPAYAGLRPGEALGLELRHVREHTLLIEQAVSDGRLKVQKTGRAYRTVDLLAPLAHDLNAWTSCTAAIGTCDALLFARPDATPWRTDDWRNWRGRHFLPAANRVGLGRPRPYDLRHSFASLLIREQKSSVVDIAEQLGHAAGMTLSTYGHVFSEHRRLSRSM